MAMTLSVAKRLAGILSLCLLSGLPARAECAVNVVIVKGRVENPPDNARVRVQLVYPQHRGGDVGELILAASDFSLPVEFLTQSRRPRTLGSVGEKCDRKPETVIVILAGSDPAHEYMRVTLDVPSDFEKTDSTTYTVRSAVILKGPK
jgi:hypothetical protein